MGTHGHGHDRGGDHTKYMFKMGLCGRNHIESMTSQDFQSLHGHDHKVLRSIEDSSKSEHYGCDHTEDLIKIRFLNFSWSRPYREQLSTRLKKNTYGCNHEVLWSQPQIRKFISLFLP